MVTDGKWQHARMAEGLLERETAGLQRLETGATGLEPATSGVTGGARGTTTPPPDDEEKPLKQPLDGCESG